MSELGDVCPAGMVAIPGSNNPFTPPTVYADFGEFYAATPKRSETIKPFCIDQTEATNAEWEKVMKGVPYPKSPEGFDAPNQPKVGLKDPFLAKQFCERQGKTLLTPHQWFWVETGAGRGQEFSTKDGRNSDGIVYSANWKIRSLCPKTTAGVGSQVGHYVEIGGNQVYDMDGNAMEVVYGPDLREFSYIGGSFRSRDHERKTGTIGSMVDYGLFNGYDNGVMLNAYGVEIGDNEIGVRCAAPQSSQLEQTSVKELHDSLCTQESAQSYRTAINALQVLGLGVSDELYLKSCPEYRAQCDQQNASGATSFTLRSTCSWEHILLNDYVTCLGAVEYVARNFRSPTVYDQFSCNYPHGKLMERSE